MSNLELNKGDNFIFGIDVSGSMNERDVPGGVTRIDHLKEQVVSFVREASKYDEDGVDILAFGHTCDVVGKATLTNAGDLITPLKANQSQTRTDLVIEKAYELHKAGGYKQSVLFLATDGEPTGCSQEDVKNVIRKIAGDLKDEHEFAISILTVGVRSPGLQAFLTDLDDNLGAKHDIVDVKELQEVDFLSAFTGALHD